MEPRPTSEKPHEPVKATINASDKNIQMLQDIFTAWGNDFKKPIEPETNKDYLIL